LMAREWWTIAGLGDPKVLKSWSGRGPMKAGWGKEREGKGVGWEAGGRGASVL